MKIAINALSAKDGGGLIYLNHLISYLYKINKGNEFYIFIKQDNYRKIMDFEDNKFHLIGVNIRNLIHRLIYEQINLPILLKQFDIDVIYAPAEIAPLLSPCPVVLGIQNLNIYYKTVIKHSPIENLRFYVLRCLAKLSSKKAKRIIFVSNSANKIIAPKLNINLTKTRVVYHGVEYNVFQKFKVSENSLCFKKIINSNKYILFLSSLARHKNIETLIKAYANLDDKFRDKYKLIIAGKKIFPYYNELITITNKLNINKNVIFLDSVPYKDVPNIYQKASLFILPSYLETFGITIIEAMAAGVPIVASNAFAIPEVLGYAGLLFDPYNSNDLKEKMEEILSNQNLRNDLIKKGLKRAKLFPWGKCAKETLSVLKEAGNMHIKS
jgi:glycosyltransferase involved in cell wall biosynthesis